MATLLRAIRRSMPRRVWPCRPAGNGGLRDCGESGKGPDGLAVLDADRNSKTYGTQVSSLTTTHVGDELHHFGWNACSSSLCPTPRIRMSSAATCWRPASAHRGFTSSTPNPTRARRGSSDDQAGGSREPGRLQPAAHQSLRTRRHLRQRPRLPTATARAASSSSTTTPLRSAESGSSTVAHSISPTTSGGTWATTR